MEFISIADARRKTGLSYIGMVNNSAKHEKAYHYNEMVYTIYLAPANMSGYEVCAGRTAECTEACLSQSGRNKMDTGREVINTSRIKKTKLFFEERQFFVQWVIAEIESSKRKADKLGYRFSVRLNNTSDISPEDFYIIMAGIKVNILEYFPTIQFYDYTKIPNRIKLLLKYKNYDLTYSYNGYNEKICKAFIESGACRVAVVFNKVPETFWNHPVIIGDSYDMRYLDPKNVICGLKYKKVRNSLNINNKFVLQ